MDPTVAIHGHSPLPHRRLYRLHSPPKLSSLLLSKSLRFPTPIPLPHHAPRTILHSGRCPFPPNPSTSLSSARNGVLGVGGEDFVAAPRRHKLLALRALLMGAAVGFLAMRCRWALAAASVEAKEVAWAKALQLLRVLKEQGPVLAGLLGMSAFFSMAETSITTLWPWKVRELAEKEPENGVFRILRSDVNRFLTTILIGTTVVNIGATAIVTDAATAMFGEAGVTAATGVMTVAVLLLTEITPKSIAVHNATEVARIVVRPVAWLSWVLYPLGKVATFLSMGIQRMLGLNARSQPYVTEDELKLMLRGAELSGAIEEEEQDMIENVLEIKDTDVKEVMTPLVDVVAIDASAKLIDFQKLWATSQYSRVPVFEQRIDNIIGIAYAMDMLEYVEKVEQLEESTVGDIVHKPTYFVPESMNVWNLLREFRVRKVHMAVVLNEYGGTVGIVTLEDVVEEIVGEIFDENDSKEEIKKKTGYIVMLKDGSFCVDANTSMDQLSEELCFKIPEGRQYETVSGFVCESFGCIPNMGEKLKVVLETVNEEDSSDFADAESEQKEDNEKHQVYELEILQGNERRVESVLFRRVTDANVEIDDKGGIRIVVGEVENRIHSPESGKGSCKTDSNSSNKDELLLDDRPAEKANSSSSRRREGPSKEEMLQESYDNVGLEDDQVENTRNKGRR